MNIAAWEYVFSKYVSDNFNKDEEEIELKFIHSKNVEKLSQYIAQSERYNKGIVLLARLIGLIHDIGRFPQWQKYATFKDRQSIDHGELGVEVLFNNNLIRQFIDDNRYDEIIKQAILHHNKYQLPNNLDDFTLLFCKIVRDADKIDILRIAAEDQRVIPKTENYISNGVYQDFIEGNSIKIAKLKTKADVVILKISMMFDLNYNFSLHYLKESKYIEQILTKAAIVDKDKIIERVYSYYDERFKEEEHVREKVRPHNRRRR